MKSYKEKQIYNERYDKMKNTLRSKKTFQISTDSMVEK